MRWDALIIGAGVSGLAAGVRVAMSGRRVLVLERHTVWGGLNSFYKKDGHPFDVGLHALTNWVEPGRGGRSGPRLPLERVCRQLRIRMEALELEPQRCSSVRFPGATLFFENGLERLRAEIARVFPAEVSGFDALAARCEAYPDALGERPFVSTRAVLAELIREPLLVEMLLCPLCFYGSATEEDLDFGDFTILFNSIYREGFCRPRRGVRQILDVLVKRLAEAGGEMIRGRGVTALEVEGGRVRAVITDRGERLEAEAVISTAGLVETEALRSDRSRAPEERAGRLGFLESLWILDGEPAGVAGHQDAITFFSTAERFAWRRPEVPVDLSSGVLCTPSNYAFAEPLDRFMVRATHLADPRAWFGYGEAEYRAAKDAWVARSLEVAERFVGPFGAHVRYTDAFTPKTVTRYTGHRNGAVYGSPHKVRSGATDLENLFLAGTDQGLVGIVGAMLSGIAVANGYVVQGGGA